MYAFIDESGESGFSSKSSKYFIVAAITFEETTTPRRIAKNIFTKARLYKQGLNQIHSSDISVSVKKKLIKELSKYKFDITFSIVNKNATNKDYYLETLFNSLQKLKKNNIDLVTIATKDNRKIVKDKILEFANLMGIDVEFSTPTSEKALQIADFVAWSLFQKYEKGDSFYIDAILKK